jgi:choline dehydrogenase-like flavoprotein
MIAPESDVADVVIIGAGAGGAACAWALTQMNVRVVVLEAGPRFQPDKDYMLDKTNWEQQVFPTCSRSEGKYSFAPLQKLEARHDSLRSWNHISGRMNPEHVRYGWKYHHVRGVGGSTLHFTGESHRMNPQSMTMASRFGVAADWPVTYQELEPYYLLAENCIGVAGPDPDAIRPRSSPYPLPAHKPAYASRKLIEGFEKSGMSWMPNARAALSKAYDGRPGCNYCGNCNRGCPRRDKGSADVTFMAHAAASGFCTIKTLCHVINLATGKNDRIHAIEYIDGKGRLQRFVAPVFVLACGAIETPRLLLSSQSSSAPDGVANESGLVGKNLMETISWISSGVHPENLGSFRGLPSDIISWHFNAPDAIPGIIGGCRFSPVMSEANLVGPINYAQRVVKGWGRSHKQALREVFGRVLSIGAIGESLPNHHTYVDLEPDFKDSHGNPIARIHSQLDEQAIARMTFMAQKAREILHASGTGEIFEEYGSYDMFSSTHVFGTARMGNDPTQSVVDRDCRSHRWKNLYIADASVFPSSGGGEAPSLTIEALAIRVAGIIKDKTA